MIVLRFVGPTSAQDASEYLSALSEMLPAENANIVFDWRELRDHHLEAKVAINRWLRDNGAAIGQLTVVVSKTATMIKMALAMIGLASGIKIRIVDDPGGDVPSMRL